MKNKLMSLALLTLTVVSLYSCASSRSRYGCPSTAHISKPSVKS